YRVLCTFELKPRGAAKVYAEVPGILTEIAVKPGQQVKAGDELGRLRSIDLDLEISDIEAQIAQQKAREEILQYEQFVLHNASAGLALPGVQKSLAALETQLAQRQDDKRRLTFVAPVDGTVLPPPEAPQRPDRPGDLSRWTGSPLERKNL